ncbi:S1 RNA-binding domain-containing protein [Micromonospora zingiberis]|uniref:S1 RNA-binding domain-containing protein n=1 Tax=Micromonospora zingiberis TaxID=2053011 RepID=UPI0013F414F9|nr:S1 RNA-binding domain-containing protein [Micromonospora zingiberis]
MIKVVRPPLLGGAIGPRPPVAWATKLERGQVTAGVVVEVKHFGVFVDLGGVTGMVNCAELSWKHFDGPVDVVTIGDRLTVMVMAVDPDRERVALSLKGLEPESVLGHLSVPSCMARSLASRQSASSWLWGWHSRVGPEV